MRDSHARDFSMLIVAVMLVVVAASASLASVIRMNDRRVEEARARRQHDVRQRNDAMGDIPPRRRQPRGCRRRQHGFSSQVTGGDSVESMMMRLLLHGTDQDFISAFMLTKPSSTHIFCPRTSVSIGLGRYGRTRNKEGGCPTRRDADILLHTPSPSRCLSSSTRQRVDKFGVPGHSPSISDVLNSMSIPCPQKHPGRRSSHPK